jgi:hypothetical protein
MQWQINEGQERDIEWMAEKELTKKKKEKILGDDITCARRNCALRT